MRKLVLIIPGIIYFLSAVNSQSIPAIEWQKCLGGDDIDVAYSVSQISGGDFIVAGSSQSNNGDVSGNHGMDDYWVVKLDTDGSIIWQKSLGGSNNDEAHSIQQTTDEGFIVAGECYSNDDDVTGHHDCDYYSGCSDYWIVKLDFDGNLVWQKSLGGSDNDYAYSIQQTTDGGFIAAGGSYSMDSDVSGNHGSNDYWVVKLDSVGIIEWQKSFGGSSYDDAFSIQQTIDGGFVVGGQSNSNDGDISDSHGEYDYWILKLNPAGNLIWQKSLGGSSNDQARSVQQTSDGGFIVAGLSYSNDGDVTEHHGSIAHADYWIVKLDTAGNLVWQKSLGGTKDDYALSIRQTNDNGFIIAGWSLSNDGEVTGNHGSNDYWVVKLDTAGNLEWQQSLGGSFTDDGISIRQTSDDGFIVAGETGSNDGDVSGNHGGYYDCWIVKLSGDVPTGIAAPNNFISLFPNPVQTQLTINLATPSNDVNIFVYDLQGKIIDLPASNLSGWIPSGQPQISNSIQVNTLSLPIGFYLLQVINKKTGKTEVAKFVKN